MSNKKSLFGTKLRLLRNKKEVSQEYCARKVGCALRTWRRWEKGEAYPIEVYRPSILGILPELKEI
jgi:transcriptional regulator with XRE-family HTH domain